MNFHNESSIFASDLNYGRYNIMSNTSYFDEIKIKDIKK